MWISGVCLLMKNHPRTHWGLFLVLCLENKGVASRKLECDNIEMRTSGNVFFNYFKWLRQSWWGLLSMFGDHRKVPTKTSEMNQSRDMPSHQVEHVTRLTINIAKEGAKSIMRRVVASICGNTEKGEAPLCTSECWPGEKDLLRDCPVLWQVHLPFSKSHMLQGRWG